MDGRPCGQCSSIPAWPVFSVIPWKTESAIAIITVVGQCVGADRYEEARYYVKKLFTYSYTILIGLNLIMFAAYPLILGLYNLQPATESVAWTLSVAHGIGACTIWALSFSLPNVLRAAGDVRFTMIVSVTSMWGFPDYALYVIQLFHGFWNLWCVGRHVRGLALSFCLLRMAIPVKPMARKESD